MGRIWCPFSLPILPVRNIHVCRKGIPVVSDVVNRPGDVGTWNCAFLMKYFNNVYIFLFSLRGVSVIAIQLCVQGWKSEIVLIPYRDPFSIFQEHSTRGNSGWVVTFELISTFVLLLNKEVLISCRFPAMVALCMKEVINGYRAWGPGSLICLFHAGDILVQREWSIAGLPLLCLLTSDL